MLNEPLLNPGSSQKAWHYPGIFEPLHCRKKGSISKIRHQRQNDTTPLDAPRNRTRPPTPAQNRQRQENPLPETPEKTKGTGQITRAPQDSQTQKEVNAK